MTLSFSKSFAVATVVAAWSAASVQASPSSILVAFRAAKSDVGRHITAGPKGALILGSKVLTHKETFTLVDLNGGALKNGDTVQVTYDSGDRPSYWREADGKVTRTGEKPDAACVFKVMWKQPNTTLTLRAASGKYVSGPGKGKPITVVAKATDPSTVFTLLKNPKPVKVVRKAAPKAAAKVAPKH